MRINDTINAERWRAEMDFRDATNAGDRHRAKRLALTALQDGDRLSAAELAAWRERRDVARRGIARRG